MARLKRFLFVLLLPIIALGQPLRPLPSGSLRGSLLEGPAPAGSRPSPGTGEAGPPAAPLRLSLPVQHSVPFQLKDPRSVGVGRLLVAGRGLGDPNFSQRVVLIVHEDDTSVVGLVLNRHTDLPLSRILNLKDARGRTDTAYIGGPVEPSSVLALVQSPTPVEKAESVCSGVYLISDKGLFERTLSSRPDPHAFHVFLGYSGWTRDQLRSEVELGAWYIFPAAAATVFSADPDSLWLEMIHLTELQTAAVEPLALRPSLALHPPPALHPRGGVPLPR